MTLKDIAALANCSTATVSRVINNEKGVSEATRKQIQQIIDEYHFQPNKAAKGLAEQKTNTLLFVYENTPDNPFFTELIRGAIDGAKEAHQILLFNIICDCYVTDYFLNALRSEQIDGVIVASTGLPETINFAKMVAKENRHLVLLNDPIDELNVPRIYINNDQAAYQATRHLLECGHTRIGHIGGRTSSYPSYQRYEGYYRAMFRQDRMYFTAVADMEEKKVFGMVQKALSVYSTDPSPVLELCGEESGDNIKAEVPPLLPAVPQFQRTAARHNHQAHCIIGARAYAAYDSRRTTLSLLVNILGGPVANSMLNLLLRERYGLVYSVDASYGLYSDAGITTIYFGCEKSNLNRCLSLTAKVLASLREEQLSTRTLSWAKKQLLGQMAIASDNGEAQVLAMGKSLMTYGRVISNAETARLIEKVTAEDIRSAAAEVFDPAGLSTLIYT